MGVVYSAVDAEALGTPAVTLVNIGFKTDAASSASHKGMPGVRVVLETVPAECRVEEQIEAGVSAAMDAIIDALTRPLTEEEKSPTLKEEEKPSRIVFKGSLEEVNQFFYRRGWTDGLPVIPPTEEAVRLMVEGSGLPADHLMGKLGPRYGKATVEKIAINAVMAGALPTHMPVLIAAVNAMLDPFSNAEGWSISAGSWAPVWIINGPVRNDLNLKNGIGALSPGNIGNAGIGRAMALITQNIRGVRHGIECMGTIGNPMKYSMVVAENEEESPWEPLHVEHGFKKEDSTVSVFFPNSLNQGGSGIDAKGIVDNMARSQAGTMTCYIIPPHRAEFLAKDSWTKEAIKKAIVENTGSQDAQTQPDQATQVKPWLYASDRPPQGSTRGIFSRSTDRIQIVVAGGGGNMIGRLSGAAGGMTEEAGSGKLTIKKIELPSNWDTLVKKYKNVVATYALY